MLNVIKPVGLTIARSYEPYEERNSNVHYSRSIQVKRQPEHAVLFLRHKGRSRQWQMKITDREDRHKHREWNKMIRALNTVFNNNLLQITHRHTSCKLLQQEAQLSPKDRAMLRVIKYFDNSFKITQVHSKLHNGAGRVQVHIFLCMSVSPTNSEIFSVKMAWPRKLG